jgi:hypothetical protein
MIFRWKDQECKVTLGYMCRHCGKKNMTERKDGKKERKGKGRAEQGRNWKGKEGKRRKGKGRNQAGPSS